MKGLIYWFTDNSVASNILMVLILIFRPHGLLGNRDA